MATIDIGPGAINRASAHSYNRTLLCVDNPANANGKITSVEIWANANLSGCKVGTFYGSGTSYTSRDYATIGNVTAGSKQTFGSLSIDVQSGDYIGIFYSSGGIEADLSGFAGVYQDFGDQFGTGAQTYTLLAGDALSVHGEGATVTVGHSFGFVMG